MQASHTSSQLEDTSLTPDSVQLVWSIVEPKSSAQTRVTEKPGLSESSLIMSMNGLTQRRNKSELRGQPVLTPHNTQNRKDSTSIPEENTDILV